MLTKTLVILWAALGAVALGLELTGTTTVTKDLICNYDIGPGCGGPR